MKIENITEMTAGATGSGSVASVAQPVGKMQKRAGSLFKGKTTKKPFYEQDAAISSISQGVSEATLSEEDFILMPGQGHKLKPGLISKRPDHEVEMARGDLYQSAKNAKQICDMLSNVSEMQGLDGWVQAKITKASDYLNSVRQYLEGRQQAVSETEKPSAREKFNKGLKKAGYDPEKGADRLFSLLKKQAEEREKFEKAMPAVYGDKEGVAEGYPKHQDLSGISTERLKAYVKKVSGGGVPQFGAGAQLKRVQQELKRREQGMAEGSLNEFAPDGFNGGDDDEGFSPEIAKMAQEDGFTKGAGLADGATLERAITINHWHSQHGGMYKQYFTKGFKAGRMNKINHDNKQYNLNLQLNKDGSVSHGEQGVAEGEVTKTPSGIKHKATDKYGAGEDPTGFNQKYARDLTSMNKSEVKRLDTAYGVEWKNHGSKGVSEDSSNEDPCWKDYRQLGTKKKNGKTVPNCVPKKK